MKQLKHITTEDVSHDGLRERSFYFPSFDGSTEMSIKAVSYEEALVKYNQLTPQNNV